MSLWTARAMSWLASLTERFSSWFPPVSKSRYVDLYVRAETLRADLSTESRKVDYWTWKAQETESELQKALEANRVLERQVESARRESYYYRRQMQETASPITVTHIQR